MRRFVKTFFVKRLGQVTVLQDGGTREVEVWRWRAAERQIVKVTSFPYAPGCAIIARTAAIVVARQLADAEALQEPAPTQSICAWCPGFDPTDPANAGKSHTICPECHARMNRELDETAAARPNRTRDDDDGVQYADPRDERAERNRS